MSVPTPNNYSSSAGYQSGSPTPNSSNPSEPSTQSYSENNAAPGSEPNNFTANNYPPNSPYPESNGYPGGFPHGMQSGYPHAYTYPQAAGYAIPAGYQPVHGQPGTFIAPDGTYCTQKSRVVAGVLGILLGSLGIHRFYLGHIGIGIIQILVSIFTFGMGSIWGFIEGIVILCSPSTFPTDAKGLPLA